VVDVLEKKGTKRNWAIIYVFAIGVLIVLAMFGSVVPQIIKETRDLATSVPGWAAKFQDRAEFYINNPPKLLRNFLEREGQSNPDGAGATDTNLVAGAEGTNAVQVSAQPQPTSGTNTVSALASALDLDTITSATGMVAKFLPKVGSWLFGQVGRVASWFGFLAGLALVPIYAFYLLLEKRGIQSKWTDYLPLADSNFKKELVFVLSSINDYLIAFFRGQVLVAICDGIMYTIGFLAIGLPYAVLLGAVSVFLTMIPFLGAIVTCSTALVIALASGGWVKCLLVILVFAIVQGLEGFVVSPKIMGDRVGLHPLTIIIAVMAGTTLLGGLLGGILAIPLTAVLRVVVDRYIWKRAAQAAAEPANPGAT
jgi:predicted PurR-regulated permease PerM